MLGIGVPKSRWWLIPVPVYLITHPTVGPILVDTAFHGSVATKPSANLGKLRGPVRQAADRARAATCPHSSASGGIDEPT